MTSPASAEPAEGHMTSDACPEWNLDKNGRCMDERTSASAEPTEGELLVAHELLDWAASMRSTPSARDIARALASQRAEIVARYEKVADRLDGQARILRKMALTVEDDEGAELAHAAAAIREAAPK